VFVADPGPTSDEAKMHASEVVHLFAPEV